MEFLVATDPDSYSERTIAAMNMSQGDSTGLVLTVFKYSGIQKRLSPWNVFAAQS